MHRKVIATVPGTTHVGCLEEYLGQRMERWNENREVEPYKERLNGTPFEHHAYEYVMTSRRSALPVGPTAEADPADSDPRDPWPTWERYTRIHNAYFSHMPERHIELDEHGPYTWSTRNPEPRWTSWEIGGLFSSSLLLASVSAEHRNALPLNTLGFDDSQAPSELWADAARLRDIDITAMRARHIEKQADLWRQYRNVCQGNPPLRTWEELEQGHPGTGTDELRRLYLQQPSAVAVRGAAHRHSLELDDAILAERVTLDVWTTRAHWAAIPGYAHITLDGQWDELPVGYWHTALPDKEREYAAYNERATTYLTSLAEDTWLVVLDVYV